MQGADEALSGYKCIYMSLFEMVYLDGVFFKIVVFFYVFL